MSWDCDELPAPQARPELWLTDSDPARKALEDLPRSSYPEPCMGSAQFAALQEAGLLPRSSDHGFYLGSRHPGSLADEVRDLRARVKALEQVLSAREFGIVAPTERQVKLVQASRNTPEDDDFVMWGVARIHAPSPSRPYPLSGALRLIEDAHVAAGEVRFYDDFRRQYIGRFVNVRVPMDERGAP